MEKSLEPFQSSSTRWDLNRWRGGFDRYEGLSAWHRHFDCGPAELGGVSGQVRGERDMLGAAFDDTIAESGEITALFRVSGGSYKTPLPYRSFEELALVIIFALATLVSVSDSLVQILVIGANMVDDVPKQLCERRFLQS
ncbi:hypothetical protein FLAG1_11763 [Fusarium langsethiae]|uniref:Uncharacterized protein n=1 Tax=Fusarium langsethiae TaxID=179993 RepID=A0A0M9EM41_FUSLA|nr:hypothetical protein FLAG1_11763 [Fusarium langsethiae]